MPFLPLEGGPLPEPGESRLMRFEVLLDAEKMTFFFEL